MQEPGRQVLFIQKRWLALAEIGIQHQGRSKLVDEFRGEDFDLVVTVCVSAAEECPVWIGKGKRTRHRYPDPAEAQGTDEEIMNAFRTVRDTMEKEMAALLTASLAV